MTPARRIGRINAFPIAGAALAASAAFAEIVIPPLPSQPSSVSVQLTAGARVTFALAESAVQRIEVEIAGIRTVVPLAGCITVRDVRFESIRLESVGSGLDRPAAAYRMTFQIGVPSTTVDIKLASGALSHAELHRGGRGPDDVLCPLAAGSAPAVPAQLVERLRGMPASVVPSIADEASAARERLRTDTYRQLHASGDSGVDALARALSDPDPSMRQNAAAMLNVLAGAWLVETRLPKRSVGRAVPALTRALADRDSLVRSFAATTLRDVGADGAPAVPALIRMITRGDDSDRSTACLALGGIGPPARAALPALKTLLADRSQVTRTFAAHAIASISGRTHASPAAASPVPNDPRSPHPAETGPADPFRINAPRQR